VKFINRYAAILMLATAGPLHAQDTVPAPLPVQPQPPVLAQDAGDEIRILRARLDQLEAQQRAAAQKAQINNTEQVSLDAAHRSQMLDVGLFSAGFKDGRFFIASDDGQFRWQPFVFFQFRDVTTDLGAGKDGGKDDQIDNGLEMRRLKFGFDGNAFGPDLTYYFDLASTRAASVSTFKTTSGADSVKLSNNLGGVILLDEARVKYHIPDSDFSIKAGNIKDPLLHDQIVASRLQQSAERSLTADIFTNGDGYTKGLTAIYDPHTFLRIEGGLTQGLRSDDTNFQGPPTNAYNYGAAARAEFKVFGNWSDYSQIGAVDVRKRLLVIGVGADYSERAGAAGQTVGVVDAHYADPNGLSLYGAVVDRYTDHNYGIYTQSVVGASIGTPDAAVAGRSTNEYAAVLQAGYIIDGRWEPFGRYEYMRLQGTPAGSRNDVQSITGGVNYYFRGHRAKITAQVDYLPDGIPINDTGNDVLASPGGKHEFSGIVQFQLLL
jgi:hypothetical protein